MEKAISLSALLLCFAMLLCFGMSAIASGEVGGVIYGRLCLDRHARRLFVFADDRRRRLEG